MTGSEHARGNEPGSPPRGRPTSPRYLIVNADDFGASPGVNRGILEAHVRGIVTSASLMVRAGTAGEAAALARERPQLGVGLHVDLCEALFSGGEWVTVYEVVPVDDPSAVAEEVERQLTTFRSLVGRDPTHLDSHQHVHRSEPVAGIMARVGRELGVPVRGQEQRVRYRGDFYGQTGEGGPFRQAIGVEALIAVLRGLAPGFSELACHPGYGDDLDSTYRHERVLELRALCDARLRRVLADERIELKSFRDLASGFGCAEP